MSSGPRFSNFDFKGMSNRELVDVINGRSPHRTDGISIEGTLLQSPQYAELHSSQ